MSIIMGILLQIRCVTNMACCVALGCIGTKLLAADPPPLRMPSDNRVFGTIFNNDTNNILYALDDGDSAKKIIQNYRDAVQQIVEARPGIVAQNVGNPDPVIYRSKEATSWSKYIKGHESAAMNKMLDAGTDPFQVTIEVCHAQGIPVVASYRMNAEDFYEEGLQIQDFGRQHKHLAIPGAFCLDPAHPVVYQHRMAIFREVAEKYDIDGIEFDFRRWTHMISDPLVNHPILTKMVRETRQMLDEVARRKGRSRLILGARVGPALEMTQEQANYEGLSAKGRKVDPSCRELGLDVRTWVQQQLVDYLSPSLFWPDWPGLPRTREFADLVKGKNIGIYPTLFPRPSWLNDSGEVPNRGPIEPWTTDTLREYKEGLCHLGLRCYDEGADGISMYNWYFHLHLSRMPRQWQAYYGYGMGGSPIQKYALSILGNRSSIQNYQQQKWFWPPDYESLVSDVRPIEPKINILRPNKLPPQLTAKKTRVGIANDHNPSLGVLPNGEVLLVMQHSYNDVGDGKVQDQSFLCRSTDGGLKWSQRQWIPLLGRDPYLTVSSKGTLFVTTFLSANDTGNTTSNPTAFVHRSIDGGKRWTSLHVKSEDVVGGNPGSSVTLSRNVLELKDGIFLLGVSTDSVTSSLWRSEDNGETWDKSLSCVLEGSDVKEQGLPWLGKAFLCETRQGNILSLALNRETAPHASLPTVKDTNSIERTGVFRSRDGGTHWTRERELGLPSGEVLPSLCRLRNGKGLLTFTVSSLNPPLGLRSVITEESLDGLSVAQNADVLVLDENTPADQPTGGGFGNTVQLDDGYLVSASSFRDAKGTTFVEVLRWALP